MVVMILEKVPTSLRGELTRWMLEVKAGVFVGKLSALVRDLLWEKCCEKSRSGICYQIYKTNTEQGFDMRMHGDSERSIIDVEGLKLIAVKNAAWEKIFNSN